MPISATRTRVEEALLAFAWDEWAQMGVLARPRRESPWAQDPEALLVFTFEVARADPRLFDEVLDWLAVNEHLVSVRRLRRLARDPEGRSLADGVLAWLATHRPKARFGSSRDLEPAASLTPVHPGQRGEAFPVSRPDEAFAQHGWSRSEAPASGKAVAPDFRAPINLAFRLRQLFGLGARAEVMRALLTIDAPRADAAVIAGAAGYTRRNVIEALNALADAGVVTAVRTGGEERYGVDRAAWLGVLPGPSAAHVDWIQLLSALSEILRWLREPASQELSEYLAASAARDLIERVRPDLEYAGVVVPRRTTSAEALDDLDDVLRQVLGLLKD